MPDIFDAVEDKKKKQDIFDEVSKPQTQNAAQGGDVFDQISPEVKDVFSDLPGADQPTITPQQEVVSASQQPLPDQRPEILDILNKVGKYSAKNIAKTAAFPLAGPFADIEDPSRSMRNVASSALGTVSGMVGSVPAMARLAGVDGKAVGFAEKGAQKLNEWAAKIAPENQDLRDQILQGATSMATFMVPSIGIARGLSAASKIGPMMVKLAPAIGTGISTVMEAATEQGGVYNDLIANGVPKEEAAKSAFRNFSENVLLIGLTNHLGPTGPERNAIIKALRSVGTEGVQEGMQEIFSSIEKGELPNWKQVATAAGIGGLLGGVAGGAIGEVAPAEKNLPEIALSPQAKEFLAKNYPAVSAATDQANIPKESIQKAIAAGEEAKLKGASPQQADAEALKSVISDAESGRQSPESTQTGQDSVQEAVSAGGGLFRGYQEGIDPGESYAMFNDPITKTTLMIPRGETTAESVRAKIEESRKKITRPRDIGTFKIAVKNAVPSMTQEQIDATTELLDARADTWTRMTGKPKSEYFESRFKNIVAAQEKAPGDLDQGSAAPAFYSQLQRVVESKLPNTAPVAQVRNILNDQSIKRDEVEWSNVEDFLAGKETVSKAELLEFLKENQVQIHEVVKGEKGSLEKVSPEFSNYIRDWVNSVPRDASGWVNLSNRIEKEAQRFQAQGDEEKAGQLSGFAEEANARAEALETSAGNVSGETKFSNYQLPGGENYREILFTLPVEITGSLPDGYRVIPRSKAPKNHGGGPGATGYVVMGPSISGNGEGSFGSGATAQEAIESAGLFLKENSGDVFKSPHYDELNILTHVRVNDRTTSDGKKTLFLEEVQSDWHQQGREEGYRGNRDTSKWTIRQIGDPDMVGNRETQVVDENGNVIHTAMVSQRNTENYLRQVRLSDATSGVPNAPFKKTWHELALKKVLRKAVEGGYDSISWTTGEQQTERYWGNDLIAPAVQRFVQVTKPEGVRKLAEDVFGREMASAMPLDVVDGGMLAVLQKNQVRRAVIKAFPADVVDILSRANTTPEKLFNDPKMVFPRLPVNSRDRVAIAATDAIRQTDATLRAKLRNLGEAGREGLLLPALKASDLNSREVAGLLSPESIFHLESGPVPKELASARTVTEALSSRMRSIENAKIPPTELAQLLNAHASIIHGREGLLQQGFEAPPGQGMNGFYDQIIPAFLNKYTKKWGGRVGETKIQGTPLETFDIRSTGSRWQLVTRADGNRVPNSPFFMSGADAEIWVKENKLAKVHTLEITPAMREAIMAGQPLFQSSKPQTETPEFKKWFGDSVVTDNGKPMSEGGKPLVVYHGSPSNFDVFDSGKMGEQGTSEGKGFYFTPSRSLAEGYATRNDANGAVYDVFLSIRKPITDIEQKTFKRNGMKKILEHIFKSNPDALSNYGDVEFEGKDVVLKSALDSASHDSDLDFIGGLVQGGIGSYEEIIDAVKSATGYDGVIADRVNGEKVFVAFSPTQIKSATGNTGAFDPNNPSILAQKEKGSVSFDADRGAIIKAFKNADVTTVVHELSHVFRRDLYRTLEEASPTYQEELKRDIKDLEDWAGAENGKWSVEAEEKVARGFENYMATGQAPRPALQRIFSMMADWFKSIYKFISGSAIDVKLTPKIKRVFDNMLGGDGGKMTALGAPAVAGGPERVQVAPIEGKGTKPLDKIVLDVSKAFGQKIRFGKPGPGMGARVGGVYYPGSSALVVRYSGDLDTTAHELAHSLDDHFGIVAQWAQPGMVSPFDAELDPFARFGSKPRPGADATQYRRAEGVAEYVRAWIVNPEEAINRAPKFSEFVSKVVPQDALKKLTEFSNDVRSFAGATAHEKVMANVQMDVPKSDYLSWLNPETVGDDFNMTWADKAKSVIVDDLHAFTKAIEYARGEKGVTEMLPSKNPETLARVYAGIHSKMDNIFENGMTDAKGKIVTGGGLDHLMGVFDKSDAKSLEADKRLATSFMVAQRTLEKAKQLGRDRVSGIGGGIKSDVDVANQLIADIKAQGKLGMVEEAARRYRAWADATLRYMVEKGRISEDSYTEIKKNNEYYVAMQRIMEIGPGEEIVFRKGQGGGGLGSVSDPIKEFRGSTRKIFDPYATLMENTYRSVREADRNEVLRNFRDLLVGERGMYQGDRQNLQSVGRLAESGDKNTLSIFVDGKREVWQFQPDVYKALKGLVEGGAKLPNLLRMPAQMLRASIVNFPPFAVRNVIRDLQHRSIVSDVGSGLLDSFKKRGPMDIANLKKFGGDQAGHYMKDKVDYMRAMNAAVKDMATDKNSIVALPSKLARGYMKAVEYSEMSGRLAEFSRAFDYAKNVKKLDDYNAGLFAASKARGLMDFAVAGSLTRTINQMIPFTSAAVQGMNVTLRSAANNPKQFAVRWALYALLPTLLTRAWNMGSGDDEEYKQQPNYIRDMFYNFKVGPNTWLRIPKSYEVGVLASGVERAIDAALGNKKGFDQYAESVSRSLLPIDEMALMGPFQGFVQAILNRDQFRQKAIVPQYEEKLALGLRDVSSASRVAQSLQKAVGVDARKIDFLMGEMFGYVGSTISKLSDIGRKDKRGIGIQDTGLIVSSPAYAARDVQWVMKKAAELGLEQGPDAKRIKEMTAKYWKAEGNKAKDAAAKDLVAAASSIRERWESNLKAQEEIAKKKSDIRAQRRMVKRGMR